MKEVPDMIERHDDHDGAPQQVNGRNAALKAEAVSVMKSVAVGTRRRSVHANGHVSGSAINQRLALVRVRVAYTKPL